MKKHSFCLLVSAILILCLFSLNTLVGQNFKRYPRVGVSAGAMNYLGEMQGGGTALKFTQPGFGIMGAYHFNPFMSARLNVNYGWIKGDDEKSGRETVSKRNLSFKSPLFEISTTLVIDLIPNDRNYAYRPVLTPYIFGGVSVYSFNPRAEYLGQIYELQPLGTEGQFLPDSGNEYPSPYKLTQLSIPFGVGVRYKLADNWSVELESGFRMTFTDYLDDVSSNYPDLTELNAQNPIAAALSDRRDLNVYPPAEKGEKRGNSASNDWYIYTNVTLSYIIDFVKCPTFK